MSENPEDKAIDNDDEQSVPVTKSKRLNILLFGIFLVLMISFGIFMFIIIQSYYSFPNEVNTMDGVPANSALAKIKKQWQEHDLPLDFDSFSKIINEMKSDVEKDKIPQLKEKLEALKQKIDDQKNETGPELEKEWERLSSRVDELIKGLKDKSAGLTEKIQDLQDDANQLIAKEKEQPLNEAEENDSP